jgi:hypothetical protein
MFRHACAFLVAVSFAPCAFAQADAPLFSPDTLRPIVVETLASSNIGQAISGAMMPLAPAQPAFLVRRPEPRRPVALMPLYGVGAILQGLDYASTTNALARGGREGNVALQGIVGNRPAFIALKAAAAGGIVVAAEKMWRRNPAAAVVMVVAIDSVMAAVVAHNYSVR